MDNSAPAASRPSLNPVSKLLKESWEQYKKHFNLLVGIMLLAGIGLYLQTILLFFTSDGNTVSAGIGILALLATIIYIIGMLWGFAALLNKINHLDQPMTVGQAFSAGKPWIWPLFVVGLLTGIFTIIGLILLIIPGIIVGVWLSMSMYVAIAEQRKGLDALKASKKYVEGYWWPVFGRLLLIGIIIGVVSAIIGGIGQMILGYKLGTLLQNVVSLVLVPLAVIYQFGVYNNLKSVKGAVSTAPVAAPVQS
jgi:hypothetical protein